MMNQKLQQTRDRMIGWSYDALKVQVTSAARELGLFTVLDSSWQSVDRLARLLNVDKRALGLFMDACVSLALIRKRATAYSISREMRAIFTAGSTYYIGDILDLQKNTHENWNELARAVKKGGRGDQTRF